jgi:hypothetical protein
MAMTTNDRTVMFASWECVTSVVDPPGRMRHMMPDLKERGHMVFIMA